MKNSVIKNNNLYFNQDSTESIFYTYRGKWYKGKAPKFYNSGEFRFTKDFEDNYEKIKQEIIEYYESFQSKFNEQYIPHKYIVGGWKVLSIWGYIFQSISKTKKFPTIRKLVVKYPEIISLQISILQPNTRIKAHFGGSNSLVRHHLAIHIPGKLPEVGFNLKGDIRCWEDGKLLSFCEAHRHYVWNNTNENRVVLLFDSIHPQYQNKKYSIISGVSTILLMVLLLKHFPFLNKFSYNTEVVFHKILIEIFKPFLIIRDLLKKIFL